MTAARPDGWLVTGGAGFIGSHLAEALLRDGVRVTVLDDLSSGRTANLDRLHACGGELFRFMPGSILDAAALGQALDGVGVVANLAAQVSVARSVADPAETMRINDDGFRAVLAAATAAGVRRFVYASSAAVYGDNPALPLVETADLRPLSPYADSKIANEQAARETAAAVPGASLTGLRFFNVYGPHQSVSGGYAAVIPAWRAALRAGRPPVVFGDGGQTRDFCHISDVVAVIRAAAAQARPGAAVYNVGSGATVTLLELLAVMSDLLRAAGGNPLPPVHEAPRPGDIRHSACDIGRLCGDLGHRPAVSLADGLAPLMSEPETAS